MSIHKYVTGKQWERLMKYVDEHPRDSKELFYSNILHRERHPYSNTSYNHQSAMHIIATECTEDVLKWAISKASSPGQLVIRTNDGSFRYTPLRYAIDNNKEKNAELLSDAIQHHDCEDLKQAADRSMRGVVQKLISLAFNARCPCYLTTTILRCISENEKLLESAFSSLTRSDILYFIKDAGYLDHPLLVAVQKSFVTCVGYLLNLGANPDGKLKEVNNRNHLLCIAIKNKNQEIFMMLLKYGAMFYSRDAELKKEVFLEDEPYRLLNVAGVEGDIGAIRRLFSTHMVDLTDFHLKHIALNADVKVLDIFLSHITCNLNKSDSTGSTALHYAIMSSPMLNLEALLVAGVAVDAVNDAGHTALGVAHHYNNSVKVKLLFKYGAKVCLYNQEVLKMGEMDGNQADVGRGLKRKYEEVSKNQEAEIKQLKREIAAMKTSHKEVMKKLEGEIKMLRNYVHTD